MRAALYVRVSTDDQTTLNQRLVLEGVASRKGWDVVGVYEDSGISGSKGREGRPGLDLMLKDARKRRFDVVMFWAIDRLGRSVSSVCLTFAELDACGVAIYADREGMDATTPHGRAMLQMAAVFAELERAMIRDRVKAGLARAKAAGVRLGRAPVPVEKAAVVRRLLSGGTGMCKAASLAGVGVSTVQRIKREMAA